MSVLLEFSMFPTDLGESKSKYVSKVLDMIDKSGVKYQLTPMGTIVEVSSIKDALDIVQKSYDVLEPYSNRVYSSIKIDMRKGKADRMDSKIVSVEKHIGEVNK
jgi:uncharacterized protein (TIGR00106 family)